MQVAYFTDLGYVERLPFRDGQRLYCRRCDAAVPVVAKDGALVCGAGHRQHAANALVNGSLR